MKDMLKKIWDESWEEDKYDGLEDCIIENCPTYEDMGTLFTQLLEYFGGKYDDKALQIIVKMMGEYINENL